MSMLRTLDIFAGACGGWSLGLHRAGFTTVAACEIDPWRRAVFSHNNPGAVIYGDVRELTATRLVSDLGFLPEIICGSPPCQDASTANTSGRGVDGARTGLFAEALRLVRELRPNWALFENVPGLRARGYDWIANELEEAGYAVWPLVVGAVHAGAPHLRKRVWIVAKSECVRNVEPEGIVGDERGRPGDKDQRSAADACQSVATGRRETGGRSGWPKENAGSGLAANAVHEGMGERLGGANGERAILPIEGPLEAFRNWNGGPPETRDVDDGLSATLASRRGLGRACRSAYGDSVVPALTEIIGRAVLALEAAE